MMVEVHWRVSKHNHLYHHNRPRLDMRCFIIMNNYCTDLISSYRQKIVMRRALPAWEGEFIKTWNNHYLQLHDVPRDRYITNIEQWACSYPKFYTSRFLLCK
ncbi:hypothetical protein BC941DRAFT_195518 [Chlamydoabsidia padenii]|nr:hypothetical protein BC941DRAFT_195518 [Chlamydoabsidia padenii]